MKASKSAPIAIAIAVLLGGFVFWEYGIKAHVAGPDEFLVIRSKYGKAKPEGRVLAEDGERGYLRKTYGTGRHFINPIFYDVEVVKALTVPPGKVGIVTSKDGPAPKSGTIIAERGERGVWREVLGPGVYKMNPKAYVIEVVNMTRIPPGCVGVLVNLVTSKVESATLPPGLHKINTRHFRVDIVDTGVKHLVKTTQRKNGKKPQIDDIVTSEMLMSDNLPAKITNQQQPIGGAIEFPSKDGFSVALDASVIYEVLPSNAQRLIAQFGRTDTLTRRIIDPAIKSVTRNVGSTATAKEIIQGETRTRFQRQFTDSFLKELAGKPVKALDALPRGLYVPPKIQLPIMQATIKTELKLTNEEIEKTTDLRNTEEQERKKINLEIEKVKSETEFEVSNISSESLKMVAEYEAETSQKVANLRLDIAKIEAQTRLIQSEGEAEVVEYKGLKEATLLRQRAAALGGKAALVQLNFVEALPKKIPFQVIHSGEGTMWTDIQNMTREQGAVMKGLRANAKSRSK